MKRIDATVENYLIIERRWNDLHFKSRKILAGVLADDFDFNEISIRRLGSIEKRMRAFRNTYIANIPNIEAKNEREAERFEKEMKEYEISLKKFEASDNPKKRKPRKPADPKLTEIVQLADLIDRPKSGDLEITFSHRMGLAPMSQVQKRVHIITSGQIGAEAFDNGFKALQQYKAHRHGALWVGASTYGHIKIDKETGSIESSMDPIFNGHIVIDRNVWLNENCCLNTMRMRPTLRYPLAGLSSTEGNATEFYFHPKNDMRFIAQSANNLPRAKVASASCTIPNYSRNSLGQQDKTGELAQKEHAYGAWIVEIESEKVFHMRPIVMDKNGCFYDSFYTKNGKFVTKRFTPNGVEDVKDSVKAIVTGDEHFAVKPKIELPWKIGTCPQVYEATYGKKGIINELKIPEVFIHDAFDGHSISHHNEKNSILLEHMYQAGLLDLEAELDNYYKQLERRVADTGAKLKIVASNHPEHLDRYLTEERFNGKGCAYNIINKRIGTQLWLDAVNDPSMSPLESYSRKNMNEKTNNNVVFLKRDTDVLREGIRLDMHGDLGANGSRASDKQLHNLGIKCFVGHRHTPGINGLVWTVGTSTYLKVQYTRGLSSWVNTHGLVYKGGQRQLINIIDGRFGWNPSTHAKETRNFDTLQQVA